VAASIGRGVGAQALGIRRTGQDDAEERGGEPYDQVYVRNRH
jgi:hypothetical protein